MTDREEVAEEMHDLFGQYKQREAQILICALNDLQTCECGHKSRIKQVQAKMLWYRLTVLVILTMVLMLVSYSVCLNRYYNHVSIFGGCSTSFLWRFDDCPVAF